jgi:hypothetical protein
MDDQRIRNLEEKIEQLEQRISELEHDFTTYTDRYMPPHPLVPSEFGIEQSMYGVALGIIFLIIFVIYSILSR